MRKAAWLLELFFLFWIVVLQCMCALVPCRHILQRQHALKWRGREGGRLRNVACKLDDNVLIRCRYELLVDGEEKKAGSILEDFDPAVNPPEEIDDPKDSKPDDWVDSPKCAATPQHLCPPAPLPASQAPPVRCAS